MKVIKDICYGKQKNEWQLLDIYLPDCSDFSVLIYFHGGGLECGDKLDGGVLAQYLNQKKVAVVSVNYRMYPNAKYPQFLEDAAESVSWTYNNISNYGNCGHFYIGGSSAGGYISMMLCFDKNYLLKCGIKADKVDGYIHDAGQPTCHFNVLGERGMDSRRIISDSAAPIFFVGMESKYPPMLFIVSDNDMQNRYEQTMLMVSTLKHFEYRDIYLKVMHGNHCSYVKETDNNNDSVLGKIIYEFIEENEHTYNNKGRITI